MGTSSAKFVIVEEITPTNRSGGGNKFAVSSLHENIKIALQRIKNNSNKKLSMMLLVLDWIILF